MEVKYVEGYLHRYYDYYIHIAALSVCLPHCAKCVWAQWPPRLAGRPPYMARRCSDVQQIAKHKSLALLTYITSKPVHMHTGEFHITINIVHK